MKLSRGALFVILIALLILLIGVIQVIARVNCNSFDKESCRPRIRISSSTEESSGGLALAGLKAAPMGRPLAEKPT